MCHLYMAKFDARSDEELLDYINDRHGRPHLCHCRADPPRRGHLALICDATQIDMLFLEKVKNIVDDGEGARRSAAAMLAYCTKRSAWAFPTQYIAKLWDMPARSTSTTCAEKEDLFPVYKMIDTCASEFESYIPYFYSTYEDENESDCFRQEERSSCWAPVRSASGRASNSTTPPFTRSRPSRASGYEAIIINNNPETVSTDYTTSDKLYFEPLCVEDVMNIIRLEKPVGVIASLGGQTAINLAEPLRGAGRQPSSAPTVDAIEKAENRDAFEKVLESPAHSAAEGQSRHKYRGRRTRRRGDRISRARASVSYVLGGRAMQIVADEEAAARIISRTRLRSTRTSRCLWTNTFRARRSRSTRSATGRTCSSPVSWSLSSARAIHSGDSISVYPSFSISEKVKSTILDYTKKLGLGIGIVGLYNIQFIVDKDENVYHHRGQSALVPHGAVHFQGDGLSALRISARSSSSERACASRASTRSIPRRRSAGMSRRRPSPSRSCAVSTPTSRPEMKSTGEAIGYDEQPHARAV